MTRRYRNGIYHYIGSLGNICTDRDTGSAKHTLRFELGMYLNRDEVEKKQVELFRSKYPTLSDIDLKIKIATAESLAR
ncbi:hypothetical protein [Dysgonomonas sp. 511]|uniref:hypothetical protein n=1 Tax=Dysgonomonas sp. 511 TaxID=2302930 RepID=UPI0013D59820|nr:hypothetical protein [Dysgonomonas sp. 511]NDV77866.1 hypothetical protein [Dysgonomonas sp. 511]